MENFPYNVPTFLDELKKFLKPYLDKLQSDTNNLKVFAYKTQICSLTINLM